MAKTVNVRLLCNRTGADKQDHYGEIVQVSLAEARRLIADGTGELAKGATLPDQDDVDETGDPGDVDQQTATAAAGDETANSAAAAAKPKRSRKR